MLTIDPVRMHWLGSVPDSADLCCHGGVRVSRSDEILVDAGGEDFALSTAAFHLLRALYHVHTEEEPLAEHLIPHCGHFMVLDEDSGGVVNIGCPVGLNWWIDHADGSVLLTFGDGKAVEIPYDEWCRAVTSFSDRVSEFFDADGRKRPGDDHADVWYPIFRAEWRDLRNKADCGR